MGDGINSPRWLGETAEPSTTRLSEEARRQLRLSLARRACRIKFNRSQNPRRMSAICAFETFEATSRVDVKRTLRIASLDVANGREARLRGPHRQ